MAICDLAKVEPGVRFPLPAPVFLLKGSRQILLKMTLNLVAFASAISPFKRKTSAIEPESF